MSDIDKNHLGTELVRLGIISPDQLDQAVGIATESGNEVESVIVKLGFAEKNQVYRLAARRMGVPYVDLFTYFVDPTAVDFVPRELAARYPLFPMFRILNSLAVAMVDPTNTATIDQVAAVSGCEVEGYLSARCDILAAIQKYYPKPCCPPRAHQGTSRKRKTKSHPARPATPTVVSAGNPGRDVATVVNLILGTAVREDATAVHIEPAEDRIRIRLRIAESLREMPSAPTILKTAIASHLKALAGLSLSESRSCQSGHFRQRFGNTDALFRVSVLPTLWGESIVLRVSAAQDPFLPLHDLGFSPDCLGRLEQLLAARRSGFLLVAGPPRSGKTTTLRAIARYLDPAHKNVIAIEDAAGQVIPFFRQVQIDQKGCLDIAKTLSEALRQDADVVLIDEVSGFEAARAAIEAALQGSLVLGASAIADPAEALVWLNETVLQPSSIQTSVVGVLSQRLIRKVCARCVERYSPPPSLALKLNIPSDDGLCLARGKGCSFCGRSGYDGKTALFELMEMDRLIGRALRRGEPAHAIRQITQAAGRRSLADAAVEKLLQGVTSLEEVLKLDRTEFCSPPPGGDNAPRSARRRSEIPLAAHRVSAIPGRQFSLLENCAAP